MNQMQPYQPFLRRSLLLLLSMGLSNACTTRETAKLPERSYLGGEIDMRAPKNWVTLALPRRGMYDPRDTVFRTTIRSGAAEARITMRHQQHLDIENLSTGVILDAYYLSRSSARFLSVTTDSASNKVVVDFLAKYDENEPLLYFRDVMIVQGRRWAIINFRGPDNKFFRDTVRQMTESIQIHPIQTPARPR